MQVFLTLLAFSLALSGCTGAKQRKAEHMEKGLALLQANNLDKARLEFSNVLQIDRKDKEAHYQLGLTLERQQNIREALSHYLAVIQLDAKDVRGPIRAGTIYLLGGAVTQAAEQADAALKLDANNPEVLALHSGVLSQKGDLDGADAAVAKLVKTDPTSLAGYGLRAGIQERRGNKSAAAALLEEAIKQHPDNLPLRYGLLKIYGEQNNDKRLLEILTQIAEIVPEQLQPRYMLADFHARKGRIDEAEKVLRAAVAKRPDVEEAKVALVRFLQKHRGSAQAEAELQTLLKQQPDNYTLKFALAQVYEADKRLDQAQSVYKDIVAKNKLGPQGLEARNKLAVHALNQKRLPDAEVLLAEVLKENPQDQTALTIRGKLALSKSDYAAAIGDFRSALHANPTARELSRLLAYAHGRNGEYHLAEEILSHLVETNPKDVEARLDLTRYYVQQKKLDEAISKLKEALQASPGEMKLLLALYQLQMDKGDLNGAQETTELVLKSHPNLPAGNQLLGMVHLAQKDFASGAEAFDAALEKSPNAADSLIQLVNSLQAQGKTQEALQRIDKTLQNNPDNAVALELKGEVLTAQGQHEAARIMFKKAVELAPKWPIPYRGLAHSYMLQQDSKRAVETLTTGMSATGDAMALVSSLAALYEQTRQYDAAIALYERLLTKEPDSVFAANNLAALLADHKVDTAGLARAAELAAKLDINKHPIVADTVGWVQFRRGDYGQAIANLSKAADSAPEAGVIRYHLGVALAANGDAERAKVELEKALTAKQVFNEIGAAKAALSKLKGS